MDELAEPTAGSNEKVYRSIKGAGNQKINWVPGTVFLARVFEMALVQ